MGLYAVINLNSWSPCLKSSQISIFCRDGGSDHEDDPITGLRNPQLIYPFHGLDLDLLAITWQPYNVTLYIYTVCDGPWSKLPLAFPLRISDTEGVSSVTNVPASYELWLVGSLKIFHLSGKRSISASN